MRGAGSARTAEQFERQFDGVRVILSDGDHPHERVDPRPAIVVATRGAEPIAAGGAHAAGRPGAAHRAGGRARRAGGQGGQGRGGTAFPR